MSKLDREIKAIIDDMSAQASELLPKLLVKITDEDLGEDEIMDAVAIIIKKSQPKTYDVYVADLKQVFREAGWIEPGTATINGIPLNTPEGQAEERKYMSGQEWYDHFIKELDPRHDSTLANQEKEYMLLSEIKQAAKRAASKRL